jgi:isocitrate dehydrogenase kinase/phosphatase
MLDGFDRHYRLFRQASAEAKQRFEAADWHGQQRAQRERIEYYDLRVDEAAERLQREFEAASLEKDTWQQVKLHYIGLLVDHHQPELAETFFNSVTTKILHRSYFHNDFIFIRPAVSTEYIENDEPAALPTYRAYYPTKETLRETWLRIVNNFQLACEFEDLERDIDAGARAVAVELGQYRMRANFQVQVLSSLFYRNKGAYLVGKVINGFYETPFALPILHSEQPVPGRTQPGDVNTGFVDGRPGRLIIDTALFGEDDLLLLFSFARAYFMVAMEIPAAYVQFLRSLMPKKPRSEIYSALGLQKQGKNIFYRDFLMHMRHSSDKFRIAPGIKGMVMLVFDLPSFPYVFKVIKDFYPAQKEDHARDHQVEVPAREAARPRRPDGRHARVQQRRLPARPLRRRAGRRAAPLLPEPARGRRRRAGDPPRLHRAPDDSAQHLPARRDAGADRARGGRVRQRDQGPGAREHLPGDMLWKNFGVTRHGKVVFYDYDEIEYLTDCNFRKVPTPRNEEEEMSGEVWYTVGPKDVFPRRSSRSCSAIRRSARSS